LQAQIVVEHGVIHASGYKLHAAAIIGGRFWIVVLRSRVRASENTRSTYICLLITHEEALVLRSSLRLSAGAFRQL
jgi:hypothetical protein